MTIATRNGTIQSQFRNAQKVTKKSLKVKPNGFLLTWSAVDLLYTVSSSTPTAVIKQSTFESASSCLKSGFYYLNQQNLVLILGNPHFTKTITFSISQNDEMRGIYILLNVAHWWPLLCTKSFNIRTARHTRKKTNIKCVSLRRRNMFLPSSHCTGVWSAEKMCLYPT